MESAYEENVKRKLMHSPNHNHKDQLFGRGVRVKLRPGYAGDLDRKEAIVVYSYAQKFDTDEHDQYSLLLLDDEGKSVDCVAWVHAANIELVSDDIDEGLVLIEGFNPVFSKEAVLHEVDNAAIEKQVMANLGGPIG